MATLGRASAPAEAQAAAADVREAGQASGAIEYGADRSEHPKVAAGAVMLDVLSFGNLLERSLEVLLVTLLGAMLYQHWDWRAAAGAAAVLRAGRRWSGCWSAGG